MKNSNFLERRFSKDPDFIYRRIGTEFLLVPIRYRVADLNYIFTLNPMAGYIWELIDGQRRVKDILDRIVADFEVKPPEAEQDLLELLSQLTQLGGIKES